MAGEDIEVIFTDEEDPPWQVVCLECFTSCLRNEFPIEDVELTHGGRVVYGAVDADPTGGWRVVNLRSSMKCIAPGLGRRNIKLKHEPDAGTIERRPDGRLLGVSRRSSDPPFLMVRLGPGRYGAIQPFAESGVKGEMTSFFGMLDADTIKGTMVVEARAHVQGKRMKCEMTRNFNMERTSVPPPSDVSEPSDGDDPTDTAADRADVSSGEGTSAEDEPAGPAGVASSPSEPQGQSMAEMGRSWWAVGVRQGSQWHTHSRLRHSVDQPHPVPVHDVCS